MIHFAVVHKGQSKMDVVASDKEGHRRRVVVVWGTDPKTDIPPDHWPQMVEQEMEIQRSYEADLAAGRIIP